MNNTSTKLKLLAKQLDKLLQHKYLLEQKKQAFSKINTKLTPSQLKTKESLKQKLKDINHSISENRRAQKKLISQLDGNATFGEVFVNQPEKLVPFLENNEYWKRLSNGDEVFACTNTCFPYKIDSPLPCLPRCVYTENKGYDEYTGLSKFLDNKTPTKKKTIFITYGPPASGKGSLQQVFTDLGKEERNMVDVNVDMIFQRSDLPIGRNYKQQLESIKQKYRNTPNLKSYTQRLYSYYRWVADQVSDMILHKAMLKNLDIKWETAGGSNVTYLKFFIEDKINSGYEVKIIYPVVSLDKLKRRVRARKDQEGASDEKIESMVIAAQQGINQLKNYFVTNKKVDIIMLDNNQDNIRMSMTNATYRSNTKID